MNVTAVWQLTFDVIFPRVAVIFRANLGYPRVTRTVDGSRGDEELKHPGAHARTHGPADRQAHARTHAYTQTRSLARTHARTHAHTPLAHARTGYGTEGSSE